MSTPYEEFAYRLTGGASLINHRHVNGDGYELILVYSGGGSVLIFDRCYPLREHTLLLIDASYPHCLNPAEMGRYVRSKLILDRRYLREALAAVGSLALLDEMTGEHGGVCLYLDDAQAEQADRQFQQMAGAMHAPAPLVRLQVMSACLPLLSLLWSASRRENGETPLEDDKLSPILFYLRAHCAEPLTVEDIAREHHLSKYYLCRLFRQRTGMTIMDYLNEQRFALARRLLADSSAPIGEIALSCGFGTAAHFSTMFRRREGCTPSFYRQATGFELRRP